MSSISEGDSDDDVRIVDPEPQAARRAPEVPEDSEILTIDDDDSDERNNANAPRSEKEGHTRTSSPPPVAVRRPKRNIQKNTVSYAEFFSDDDEDEEKIKKLKIEKDLKQRTQEIEFLTDSISELNYYPRLAKSYQCLTFTKTDSIINMDDFISLFQLCGKFVQRISIGTVNLRLLKEISVSCVNLKVLVIRKSIQDEKFQPTTTSSSNRRTNENSRHEFIYQNLKELDLSTNNFITNNPNDFKIFLHACKSIESFQYNFTNRSDLNFVLDTLKGTKLKELRSFTLCHEDEQTLGLNEEQIKLITSLDFKKLQTLHLNCGLWEDVRKEEFEGLLKTYAGTLETFTLAGNYYGTDNIKMDFSIEIPKMSKLNSISIGSVYDFEPLDQSEQAETNGSNSSSRGVATTNPNEPISLSDKSLISISISFPHIMPKLDKLILGNLFKLDQLHPQTFPNLTVFRVGSSWSTSIEIPTRTNSSNSKRRFPTFPSMRELQLPDFIRDEYFVQRINTIFPNLRKVWINIPSSKCLYLFLKCMTGSNLKELFIRTQYDFQGLLEASLVSGKSKSPQKEPQPGSSRSVVSQNSSSLALNLLLKYKNPEQDDKYFDDFTNYYNIELPLEDNFAPFGISKLPNLKVLQIVHIPRKIKIPLNNKIPHHHRKQTFHPSIFIGFNKYPLPVVFFKNEIMKMPNLEKFHHENIEVPCSYILPTMVKYRGSSSYRSDRDTGVVEDFGDEVNWGDGNHTTTPKSKRLRVKIPPSLAATQQLKVKNEQKRESWTNSESDNGPSLAYNIAMNIELPLKLEKEST